MSPNIRNAVVATEDPRFFEHGGVDWFHWFAQPSPARQPLETALVVQPSPCST
jgi:hypothetical protein